VIDSRIDPNHPELIGKIDPPYDFYSGLPFETNHNEYHGASVATLIAAETKSMGETANGSMPSIGWNTRIMYSQRQDSIETFYYPNNNTYLYFYRYDVACLYASSVKNAKVINVSWHFFNDFL